MPPIAHHRWCSANSATPPALSRANAAASAISNRDALLYFQIGGLSPDPEARAGIEAYIQRYKRDLRAYVRGGVYLNFMMGGEARRRISDAYLPQTYQRLVALKAKYDPNNLFCFSYQL